MALSALHMGYFFVDLQRMDHFRSITANGFHFLRRCVFLTVSSIDSRAPSPWGVGTNALSTNPLPLPWGEMSISFTVKYEGVDPF